MRAGQGAGAQGNFAAIALQLIGGRRPLLAAAVCTAGINILALTGPAYMLLLYDRVLPTHAGGQLLTLSLLMLLLYGLSARLDLARHEIFAGCARRADRRLSTLLVKRMRPIAVRDLDLVRAFLAGQAPAALCDLPWMPLYLGVMFLLHPLFGLLASTGAVSLVACALVADHRNSIPARAAAQLAARRWALTASLDPASAQACRSWLVINAHLRDAQEAAARPTVVSAAMLRALRPALQSAMLGLGAYLVMASICHPAEMLAASILLARALGPLETAIAHWRCLAAARASAAQLYTLLSADPEPARSAQPKPCTDTSATGGRVQIVLRSRNAYARRAIGADAGARSTSSDLRPTAE
jgi:ATP-binding cassette, subfamily C, type I secretion system permease/ATPase